MQSPISIAPDSDDTADYRHEKAGLRHFPRSRRGQRVGYLVVNGQTVPVPCTVRDFDSGTATLILGGWLGIPDSFSLYVEPDQIRLECRIAARRGNSVTVRFDGHVEETRPRQR